MTPEAAKALQHETDFLSGVETNLELAKGRDLRGSIWHRSQFDDSDRLRALLAENRIFDREALNSLPANRRIALHGFERRFLFGKRKTGVAIASVLSPLRHFAAKEPGPPPPVGLGELAEHVRKLVADVKVPHLVGICSPTGFTEEARRAKLDTANATVVLIEPTDTGGWHTIASGDAVDPRVLKIFDPEGAKQKLARVRSAIENRRTDLLLGGLSASAIAREVHLPEEIVRQGFSELAKEDSELRVARKDGEFLLFRGALSEPAERKPMNVMDRIRRLLSGEGNETAKINLLAERRAALAQRRDRIYEDITRLEKKEADLFNEGKQAVSAVPRRRIAAQLAQMRRDISRLNTTAGMLNQQINIISTDIHNLTLIQQGRLAQLPDSAELTEHAVEAEEMLESLQADAELVGNLQMGMEQNLASDEELAILREFEAASAAPQAAEAPPARQPSERRSARPAAERVEPLAKEPPMQEPPPRSGERARGPANPEAS
jgi:hypothetical protein